jgi:cell division septum initiation protein DivIVA
MELAAATERCSRFEAALSTKSKEIATFQTKSEALSERCRTLECEIRGHQSEEESLESRLLEIEQTHADEIGPSKHNETNSLRQQLLSSTAKILELEAQPEDATLQDQQTETPVWHNWKLKKRVCWLSKTTKHCATKSQNSASLSHN